MDYLIFVSCWFGVCVNTCYMKWVKSVLFWSHWFGRRWLGRGIVFFFFNLLPQLRGWVLIILNYCCIFGLLLFSMGLGWWGWLVFCFWCLHVICLIMCILKACFLLFRSCEFERVWDPQRNTKASLPSWSLGWLNYCLGFFLVALQRNQKHLIG